LYYHGARYRDAKTGVWLSVDPILEMYLEGKPNGGIYNSINLNLYAYAADNPVRYTDPDGNKFKDKVENAGIFVKRFALTSFLLLQRNTWGNPGHVSAEKLNEMEPIPPSKSKVEDYADITAWFAEPIVAYGLLKLPTMGSSTRGTTAKFKYDAVARRYRSLESGRFVAEAKLPWPRNSGFSFSWKETLQPGKIIDRFGELDGSYAGTPGATISERGLPMGSEARPYTQLEVVKPIDVQAGFASPVPEFGATGGSLQYKFSNTIEYYIKNGTLRILK